jgi:tetratricopeptide (TPR) repeat protein
MKRSFYLLLLSLFLFSCHGTKYYIKEAQKYEKEKDYDNAVANYAEAYLQDPSNKDAKKGFKKTGQKLLDQLLDQMQEAYDEGRYKDAIDQYKKTDKYYNNVKDRGIELNFPEEKRTLYQTSKDLYLQGLFQNASASINSENYSKAKEYIDELRQNDSGYPGLSDLEKSLDADPVYKNAMNAYNKGQKLIAIQQFNQVNKIYPNYRETAIYLEELNRFPKQTLAFFPVENKSSEQNLDRLVYKGVEKKLLTMQSSLFTVNDETTVQNELLKANKAAQPPFDDNSIIQISKTLLATKSVVITVSDLSEDPIGNTENFQIAYSREKVIYYDPYYGQTTNYQWRETKYKEVEEGVKYAIFIKVKIYDPVTGTIVYNDVVTKSVISKVKYAKYDGDYNDLYPTMGYISQTELNKWRSRFTAEKDKKSKSELIDILVKAANDEIYDIIFSKLN